MNVKQLIKELQEYEAEAELKVLVDCDQSGYFVVLKADGAAVTELEAEEDE